MATDYPIEITDPDGSVRMAGLADFTDPDNQPSAGGPFKPAPGDVVEVVENSDGDSILSFDDDADALDVSNADVSIGSGKNLTVSGNFAVAGECGFFGTPAVAQPVVPATPLPQDIVDALVALGLVSQSA